MKDFSLKLNNSEHALAIYSNTGGSLDKEGHEREGTCLRTQQLLVILLLKSSQQSIVIPIDIFATESAGFHCPKVI